MDKKTTATIRRLLSLEANPNYAMTMEQKQILEDWRNGAGGEDFAEQIATASQFQSEPNFQQQQYYNDPSDGQAQHIDSEPVVESIASATTAESLESIASEPTEKPAKKKRNKKTKKVEQESE